MIIVVCGGESEKIFLLHQRDIELIHRMHNDNNNAYRKDIDRSVSTNGPSKNFVGAKGHSKKTDRG